MEENLGAYQRKLAYANMQIDDAVSADFAAVMSLLGYCNVTSNVTGRIYNKY